MNKWIRLRKWWLFSFLTLSVVLLGGCQGTKVYEKLYGQEVERKKLRSVEPLQLEASPPPTTPILDANRLRSDSVELTLEECRSMALTNNLSLRTSLIDPVIAAESYNQERAKFEAAFTSNLYYDKTDRPVASSLEIEGTQRKSTGGSIGIERPLETGGSARLNFSDNRTKSDSTFSVFNPAYTTGLNFSVTQPLLRGAGVQTNMHSIRIASYYRQIVDAQTKAEVIRLIRAMDGFYWYLYAYRQEREVRKQQYELAQAQLGKTKRLVDLGERPQVELVRAEAGLAERLEAIIITENNVRLQERGLKKVINQVGLDIQGTTSIIPKSIPQPQHYDLDPNELIAMGIENRMDMLEIELRLAQDQSSIEYYRNRSLPDIGVSYRYNLNGLGRENQDAVDMIGENQFADHRFGLGLTIPLGNRAARSRLREAIYTRGQRLSTQENKKALIRQEVLNAIDRVEAGWLRIIASQENAELQGRLYEAEKRQFELGARTATDVLDAQSKLADAQSSEIRALADYQIALIDIAYYTGTLLGAANVEWEPIIPENTSDS